jgi:UDP-N-acetylglucosamine--N-acetylmuramyl-(pentapeptide) pyrophosphoryl-undecaprenol N-acetylglucosamine transferase
MILVTVGTHHQPFDRLIAAAAALQRAGHEVVAQTGTSTVEVVGGRAWIPPSELAALADRAAVIVCHAGPGSLALAWERGRAPVVVPRRAVFGEHVDDHQVQFCAHLGDRAVVWDDPATLAARWAEVAAGVRDVPAWGPTARPAFLAGWGEAVRGAVRGSRASVVRATLRRLSLGWRRWVG